MNQTCDMEQKNTAEKAMWSDLNGTVHSIVIEGMQSTHCNKWRAETRQQERNGENNWGQAETSRERACERSGNAKMHQKGEEDRGISGRQAPAVHSLIQAGCRKFNCLKNRHKLLGKIWQPLIAK